MASSDAVDSSHAAIEREAVVWLARRMSGEITAAELAAFEAWRSLSPAHAAASLKLDRLSRILPEALACMGEDDKAVEVGRGPKSGVHVPGRSASEGTVDRSGVERAGSATGNRQGLSGIELPVAKADSHFPATRPPAPERSTRFGFHRCLNWSAGLAIAACAAWVTCLGFYSGTMAHPWADHRTLVGEQKTVRLDDGSTIYLNTDTALDVSLSAGERRIDLLQGEAEFEVAHDSQRPFRVVSGRGLTEALGTRFVVRYVNETGRVTLLQGKVRTRLAPADGSAGEVVLSPGEQATFDKAMLGAGAVADPASSDAWRRQRLVMNFVTLGEVVAEINRYRPGHVWLMDPTLANRRIHVSVDIKQIDDWLDALPTTLPVRVSQIRLGHQVLLQSR